GINGRKRSAYIEEIPMANPATQPSWRRHRRSPRRRSSQIEKMAAGAERTSSRCGSVGIGSKSKPAQPPVKYSNPIVKSGSNTPKRRRNQLGFFVVSIEILVSAAVGFDFEPVREYPTGSIFVR